MLVPHHGSKSSSSETFIHAVSPKMAIVASGFNNRYRFPADEVVKRYQQRSIPLFNTAQSGALIFTLDNTKTFAPIQWRLYDKRLWRANATD